MTTSAPVTLSADQARKVIGYLYGFADKMEQSGVEALGWGDFNGAVEAQVYASDAKSVARDIEKGLGCHEEIPVRRSQRGTRAARRQTTSQAEMRVVK